MTKRKKTLTRLWLDIPVGFRFLFYFGLGFLIAEIYKFCQTVGTVG